MQFMRMKIFYNACKKFVNFVQKKKKRKLFHLYIFQKLEINASLQLNWIHKFKIIVVITKPKGFLFRNVIKSVIQHLNGQTMLN